MLNSIQTYQIESKDFNLFNRREIQGDHPSVWSVSYIIKLRTVNIVSQWSPSPYYYFHFTTIETDKVTNVNCTFSKEWFQWLLWSVSMFKTTCCFSYVPLLESDGIHSSNKNFFNTHYVPSTILGPWNTQKYRQRILHHGINFQTIHFWYREKNLLIRM